MALEVPLQRTTQFGNRKAMFVRRWRQFSKNKLAVCGLVFIVIVCLAAIFSPWVAPYSYQKSNFLLTYAPPSKAHWFGTDSLGRDLLSRVLWGLQSACIVGFGAEVVELTVGVLLGAFAAYRGGFVDNLLMRIVDVFYAFPSLFLSIILVVLLGHNLWCILVAVSATSWVGMARVVRSQVLTVRESGYIERAKAMGASPLRVILKYILPNSMGPILVAVAFGIPANMMAEAGLSVIGLGIEPPRPDLGELIIEGQKAMLSYPYLLLAPALCFAMLLLSFTFVGDGLRNVFDLKSRR